MSDLKQSGLYKYDDDEDYVPTKKIKYSSKAEIPKFKKKHTLDSDEEDEDAEEKAEKKKYILKDEDIDGQEDATIDFEGETKITPFNMKEEMEEGHFDKDGFYHFKKDEEATDAWLENIDWIKVKHKDSIQKYGSDVESDSEDDLKLPGENSRKEKELLIAIYEEMFPYLRPGESVAKSLKRLGGNSKKLSSAERWKLKKQGKLESVTGADMEGFNKVTELVNKVVETGNMDVYQETYEMINLKIKRHKSSLEPVSINPSMDMFSDEAATPVVKGNGDLSSANGDDSNDKDTFDTVKWEFKWENSDEAKIHGPYSTDQMIKWKESSYFEKGVYVRKTSEKSGPWYQSSRIEFDLYV